ncbi:basic 7S globulin 2-like [Olea europaea var. sylvestris]|uniref:Basic 7S globulin-like n=1 Tax=Olea europaea subsp. europaea TaxID=158383 RepID=A0A8S0UXH3_OLEEU|nr:basic 7S globulin 2-like [Olea europaea var. sylvestris]CAA3025522.1 basic 7S globulin-like [Olea europaea subsp. europaea]
MASTFNFLLIFFAALFFISDSRVVRAPFKPNSLVLPVHKDTATGLHVANIRKSTPRVSVPFLVDLNGNFLWVVCDQNYSSSTYNAPFCHSTQCSRAGDHYCHKCHSAARPGCHNNTCAVMTINPLTRRYTVAELAQDVVSVQSIQGSNMAQIATIPNFLFACAPSSLLQGPFPKSVQGVAGLGHAPVALPLQLGSHFGFPPQFSLCLSSSTNTSGGIFFGNAPFKLATGVDNISKSMAYTPLSIGPQAEYFILVKSIKINNKTVPFNTSLLSATRGFGGTLISTTTPYTVLEHSIFKTFASFFIQQFVGVPQVKSVPPFGLCFNSHNLPPTRLGGYPNIEFVMQNRNVSWTILGVDSLVNARPNVSCLAFVDGGLNPRASIVIGAYHLEDHLLHFDLSNSKVGYTSSLQSHPVNCANFNFTSALTLEEDTMRD